MNQELKTILDEMCSRVGAKDVNFEEDNWYLKHTWTEKEQDDFINWLANYLYENKEARKMFVNLRKVKRDCNKASNKFVLNYGWKTK
jgi:hypothetical protein